MPAGKGGKAMYANMRVTRGGEFVGYAHAIVIEGGEVFVKLDANHGGRDAVPDGELVLSAVSADAATAIAIRADY